MKSAIYCMRAAAVSLICFFGISLTFINGSMFSNFVAKGLRLKLDPAFIGGEVANEYFYDGGLVQYTIHKPVTRAKWQKYSEYWQLDLLYKEPLAPLIRVAIYIDIDNDGEGSLAALDEDGATFDPAHPWDYCAVLCGDSGKVYDAFGNEVCPLQVSFLDDRKKLVARLPLLDQGLQRACLNKSAFHYIVTSELKAQSPKTFVAQSVDMKGGAALSIQSVEEFIQAAKAAANFSLPEPSVSFESADQEIAYYDDLLKAAPDDPMALAKLGSAFAKKGGESNPAQAIKLVNQGYTYLDKAASLAAGRPEEFAVLMERAHVSCAVPEMVFGKSESGAADFTKCAELYKNSLDGEISPEQKIMLLYLYAMAAECYNRCGDESRAKLSCAQAKKYMP